MGLFISSGYWNPYGSELCSIARWSVFCSYESEFLDSLVISGHSRLARSLNLCYRYTDDLTVFSDKRFIDDVKNIYPSDLNVEKANRLDDQANYLDLTFVMGNNNRLYIKLCDKRDDLNFHIVNIPFLSSNIPSGPSYGVSILQLIRYARCCTYYDDFRYHHNVLVDRLLSQGYNVNRLRNSFQKFYGRYPDSVANYQRSVREMLNDLFPFLNTVDLCSEGFVDFHDLQDMSLGMSL